MKFVITLFFLIFTSVAFAKNPLIKDCEHLEDASQSEVTLFNKTEFIELGECLAVNAMKKSTISDLPMLCSEVKENTSNPLGIFALTKLEAIYIGQCVGVINYIHQRYHDEYIDGNSGYSRNKTYHCQKGQRAVNILTLEATEKMYRRDVRDLLCSSRY